MSRLRVPWEALFGGFVVLVLLAPMAFTNREFGDFAGHLWLVATQARNIEHLGYPSFFVQSTFGAFEPWYAFYGGTLYSLGGAVAIAIGGHPEAAFIASFAGAFAMAYGGFTWIARQLGVRGWRAHACGLLFVTSAYYVTDAFARGAWPETVATSALPLIVAAGLSLLRAEGLRLWPAAAFVLAVIVFSGSHNITLLYGTVFLALLVLAVLAAFGRAAVPPARRLAAVAALGALGVGVNLWFLLPDLAYAGHTVIAHSFTDPPNGGRPSLATLLDPVRHSTVDGYAGFDMQLPTLALLWAAVALAMCWRELARPLRRLAVGLAVVALPFVALFLIRPLWHAVPHVFWAIQFPYRLITYPTYCAVGIVMVALLALARGPRGRCTTALLAAGAVILALEAGQAVHQQWLPATEYASRAEAFPGTNKLPNFWNHGFSAYQEFQDVSLPVRAATINEVPGVTLYDGKGANDLPVPIEVPRRRYDITFTPPKTGTLNTEVETGPYLVAVHGGRFVGRTPFSRMLIEVQRPSSGAPITVTFGTAGTRPILVGRWATFLSIVALLGVLGWLAVRELRLRPRRPGGRSPASDSNR